MRVKCLAQEHNTMSPARARTRRARSGVERANHEATVPPTFYGGGGSYFVSPGQLPQGCCLTNISGAQKGKSQKVRSPTGNVLGAAAKI